MLRVLMVKESENEKQFFNENTPDLNPRENLCDLCKAR